MDYLTRFMSGTSAEEAFEISRMGAVNVQQLGLFERLISHVSGLNDDSIDAAVKLSGFDSAYRAGVMAYRPVEDIVPDAHTIENIRVMVERSLRFFEQYGPKVLDGLTFEGGYTGYVATGDGDFLTDDTLWDFKAVSYTHLDVYKRQAGTRARGSTPRPATTARARCAPSCATCWGAVPGSPSR